MRTYSVELFKRLWSISAFNLINEVDVASTEAKIQAYQTENRDLIAANLTRLDREVEENKWNDEQERKQKEETKNAYELMDEEDRAAREAEKASILASLVRYPHSPSEGFADQN